MSCIKLEHSTYTIIELLITNCDVQVTILPYHIPVVQVEVQEEGTEGTKTKGSQIIPLLRSIYHVITDRTT